ncbi:MAG: DUF4852 domain-containing protein [Pseudomonadota bacterium]
MRIFILTLLSLFVFNLPAMAQTETYVPTTWTNLARAIWHFDGADAAAVPAIDTMLRITECGIVKKYATDDFAWNDIRSSMRKVIATGKSRWPATVRFTQAVNLEAYDFASFSFPITADTDWDKVTRMQIAANDIRQENACSLDIKDSDLKLLPSAASVRLDQAFTLKTVGVLKEVAEKFVAQYPQMNGVRRAYVTFYVTLDDLLEIRDNGNDPYQPYMAEFRGRIDKIEVHADLQRQKPLFIPAMPPRHSGY